MALKEVEMRITTLERAIFLDKDGTLLVNMPYNVDVALMKLCDGAGEGLRALQEAGYKLFVISNQSGVARGLFTEGELGPVQARLNYLLAMQDVTLDGFYYCPHHPDGVVTEYSVECYCRKPNPGLLFKAARDHAIDLLASWMVGDTLDDVECGRRANCGTVLLENGNETEWKRGPKRSPHYIARNLLEASKLILENEIIANGESAGQTLSTREE